MAIENYEAGLEDLVRQLPSQVEVPLDEFAAVLGPKGMTVLSERRRRLEKLQALEILEPDPGCPGFRVRPQAGRFVRDTLHRSNLW